MFILLTVVTTIIYFYMLLRISRTSMLLAVGCFFLPPLILLALVLYWNNAESDIKVPFFISLALAIGGSMVLDRNERARRIIEGLLWGLQLTA